MSKFFGAVLVFLIVIIGSEVYFLSRSSQKTTSPIQSTQPTRPITKPSRPVAKPAFQIVRQAASDKEGRTVVFQSGRYKTYGGTGIRYLLGTKVVAAVVGRFTGWETIADSKDRYLVLDDPLTNNPLPKFHVVFTPPKTPPPKRATELSLLRLNQFKRTASFQDSISDLQLINSFSSQKLNQLIKAGDILTIIPYNSKKKVLLKDKNGVYYAVAITLRRWDSL